MHAASAKREPLPYRWTNPTSPPATVAQFAGVPQGAPEAHRQAPRSRGEDAAEGEAEASDIPFWLNAELVCRRALDWLYRSEDIYLTRSELEIHFLQ